MSLLGERAAELRAWIETVAGGTISRVERQPTVREAWAIDVARPDGTTAPLFLRCDRGEGYGINARYSLEREARVLEALASTAVPVPRIHGFNRAHKAILMERVPGRADFARIASAEERERVARHFLECLAALHALAPADLSGAELRVPGTPEEHASLELDATEALVGELSARREPLLGFALGWLRRNLPARVERTSLVQGDTGPGNFLFHEGRVSAVLDWEFAHFGDPLEDLGWICVRDVVTPFGPLGERFRAYAELSGQPLDWARVRYYRVAALARTVAALVVANQSLDARAEVATLLAWEVLFARVLCEGLAAAMGVTVEPAEPPPDPGETPRSALFALALAQARELAPPPGHEAWAAHRRGGVIGLLEHLRRAERLGPAYDARELDELGALLGRRPATLAEGLAALDALVRDSGASREVELLGYFTRRATRAHALYEPAMGELAQARLAPLDQVS